jgi:GNAT superfamily N-acetyltransferase
MNIRAVTEKFRKVVHYHGVGAGAQLLGLAALRRQLCLERVFFFELARRPRVPVAPGRDTRLATAADIVAMSQEPLWQMSDLSGADIEALLAAGHRCVLNVVDERIAGYAWMNPNRIVVPKLRLAMPLCGRTVHVYKGLTHPEFRGQRIGVDRFAHWYDQFTEAHGITVVVDFAFDNPATLARAERSGLRRVGSGTFIRRGGFERLWITGALASRERARVVADIAHRDH